MFKTILLTSLALLAFAGNSVLNRMALNSDAGQIIDAASFTSIRLISGVLFLLLIIALSAIKNSTSTKTGAQGLHLNKGSWLSAFYLFVYALAFSYAYITLETGPGALILVHWFSNTATARRKRTIHHRLYVNDTVRNRMGALYPSRQRLKHAANRHHKQLYKNTPLCRDTADTHL